MSIVAAITQRVLIIDDNPAIHNDIRKVFGAREGHGQLDELEQALFGTRADDTPSEEFAIDSAYQGQEGLTKVRKSLERGMHYDVAIVDMRMPPGWDGVETIRHIWDVDPDIQVVICTALSDYTWEEVTECLSYSDRLLIVKKPFEPCELLQAVRALSEKRRLLARSYDQLEKVNQVVEQRTAELSEAHREASLLL
jgi:CheY-like chemotaxis protein